jgi:hypothetical protein
LKVFFILLCFFICETKGYWKTASLSIARTWLAAASVKDLVLFGGGGSHDGANAFDRVDIFNATSGIWTTSSLSVARNELVAASVKDLVLFGGGYNGTYLQTVDIYNATSGIWTTASLSVAGNDLAATSVKDLVLFGGGQVVDIFNSSSGEWTTASLSIARAWLVAASVNDLVFFGGSSSVLDIFNATSGEWTNVTAYLFDLSIVTSVKDIVLFYTPVILEDYMQIFNVTSGNWTTTTLPAIDLSPAAAASVKDLAFFANGETAASEVVGRYHALNLVDIFNATSGEWTTATLSIIHGSPAAASVKDLVLFGGGVTSGFNLTDRVDIFKLCTNDADCDDQIFCNGKEFCLNGLCEPSPGDPCLNGTICNSTCNENAKNCFASEYSSCADDLFCNGEEVCIQGTCIAPELPCDTTCYACQESSSACYISIGSDCLTNVSQCPGICNINGTCLSTPGTNCTSASEVNSTATVVKTIHDSTSNVPIIVGSVVGGVIMVALIVGVYYYYLRKKQRSLPYELEEVGLVNVNGWERELIGMDKKNINITFL